MTKITNFAQFARDYNWEDTQPVIEDPIYAAEQICSELVLNDDLDQDDCDTLRAELIESAIRENNRRVAKSARRIKGGGKTMTASLIPKYRRR